jgi:hypothetical protein
MAPKELARNGSKEQVAASEVSAVGEGPSGAAASTERHSSKGSGECPASKDMSWNQRAAESVASKEREPFGRLSSKKATLKQASAAPTHRASVDLGNLPSREELQNKVEGNNAANDGSAVPKESSKRASVDTTIARMIADNRKQAEAEAREARGKDSLWEKIKAKTQKAAIQPVSAESAAAKRERARHLWQVASKRLPVLLVLANVLDPLGVTVDHITLESLGAAEEDDDKPKKNMQKLELWVALREATAMAVKWALQDALLSSSSYLRSNGFFQVDCDQSDVRIAWPMQTVSSEVADLYGHTIESSRLFKAASLIEAVAATHRSIRKELRESETVHLLKLLRMPCEYHSKFRDPLSYKQLVQRKARMRRVEQNQEEVQSVDVLLGDAVDAQRALKECIAPGTAWARRNMNNWGGSRKTATGQRTAASTTRLEADDPERYIEDVGLARGGYAVDPGVRALTEVDADAQELLRIQQLENQRAVGHALKSLLRATHPPWHKITDVARVKIAYHTVAALVLALEALREHSDLTVCWLTNRFLYPSASGFCDVVLGVRLPVRGGTIQHVAQVQLSVVEMYNNRAIEDSARALRSFLSSECYVPQDRAERVRLLIMRKFDTIGGESVQPQGAAERKVEVSAGKLNQGLFRSVQRAVQQEKDGRAASKARKLEGLGPKFDSEKSMVSEGGLSGLDVNDNSSSDEGADKTETQEKKEKIVVPTIMAFGSSTEGGGQDSSAALAPGLRSGAARRSMTQHEEGFFARRGSARLAPGEAPERAGQA